MSAAATKVWPELRQRYNGGNNGKIAMSLDQAARVLHMGKATVQRALKELVAKGFIVVTRKGEWYGRRATLWRLTDKSCDGNLPTNDWKRWQPNKKTEIGFKTDPLAAVTGPNQNRRTKTRPGTEPVGTQNDAPIGAETDR